jgi:hypothetical protein
MANKLMLERTIRDRKQTLNLLRKDLGNVYTDIAKQAIIREIVTYEKSLERKEFQLWKLEKEGN